MKKITPIFILIVFIASIFIVNFFGLPIKDYSKTIIVSEISINNVQAGSGGEITNTEYKPEDKDKNKPATYTIHVTFENNFDEENPEKNVVMLTPRVTDNATNKNVKYIYDRKNTKATFINEDTSPIPIVCFKTFMAKTTSFNFQIAAADNGGAKINVLIIATVTNI